MIRLIGSEFFKLRTTRTFYALVGTARARAADRRPGLRVRELRPDDQPLTADASSAFVQLFALVIGILAVTTEFRHGTITPSLLVAPDRVRLMLSKLVARVLLGLALGLVADGADRRDRQGHRAARDLDTAATRLKMSSAGRSATGAVRGARRRLRRDRAQPGRRDRRRARLHLRARDPARDHARALDDIIPQYGLGAAPTRSRASTRPTSDLLGQVPGGLLLAVYAPSSSSPASCSRNGGTSRPDAGCAPPPRRTPRPRPTWSSPSTSRRSGEPDYTLEDLQDEWREHDLDRARRRRRGRRRHRRSPTRTSAASDVIASSTRTARGRAPAPCCSSGRAARTRAGRDDSSARASATTARRSRAPCSSAHGYAAVRSY